MSKLPFQHASDRQDTDKAWHVGEKLNDQTTPTAKSQKKRGIQYLEQLHNRSCCTSKRAGGFRVQLILIMQSTVDAVECRSS